MGRGEAAPLAAGDVGGEAARLGWRFSWSAVPLAAGDASGKAARLEQR